MQQREELRRVGLMAFRLGATSFGGPAAHIAMLRQEVLTRRGWMSEQRFLDLLGITNFIPGPNSTEMVIHVGYERAGKRGLLLAGAAFILPAMLITLFCAWLYVRYGTTTRGEDFLDGLKPVVIAIVAQAILGLGKTALVKPSSIAIAAGTAALYLVGINEIIVLIAGALVSLAISRIGNLPRPPAMSLVLAPAAFFHLAAESADYHVSYTALRLFLTFLKIGAVLYSSGYVLVAFLRTDFVERYGWLTEQQLLDAVAVGQVTPGPVFTTATFIGYVVGGTTGAVLATIAIFLPAFVFVAIIHPYVDFIRKHPVLSVALDGVNAAAIGLMAGVAIELSRDAIKGVESIAIGLLAAVLLVRYKANATWLVLGGGIFGLLFYRF